MQLKIPVASYPTTLGQLASRLGTQLSLQQQAQDVTQQVADVNSQVTSDEAAIAGYVIYRGRRWLIRRRPTAQSASGES